MERRKKLVLVAVVAFVALMLCRYEIYAAGKETTIKQEYVDIIEEVCTEYHIYEELMEALIETESGGEKYAVSPHGAVGLCQLMPEYFYDKCNEYGFTSMFEPYNNILLCSQYLRGLFIEYEDPILVLMIYNGGPKEIEAYENGIHDKAYKYAIKVLGRADELERIHREKNRTE